MTIETFSPTSALMRVDLPALGAPMMATNPHRVSLMSRSTGREKPAPPPVPRPRCRARGADFRLEAVKRDPHDKMGGVCRTAALDLLITRRRQRARLGPFLHRRLGVAGGLFVGGDAIAPAAEDEGFGGLKAPVDEHCANQGFAHVSEDRLLLAAASPRFAETPARHAGRHPKGPAISRRFRAARAWRTASRVPPLGRLRKGLVEPAGDHDAQHPVP